MSYEVKTRTNGVKFVEFAGLDGTRKRVSLGTRDPKAAERLAREKFLAHLKGEDVVRPRQPSEQPKVFTLGMAIDALKRTDWSSSRISSWRNVWSDCDILLKEIGDIELTDFTYEVACLFIEGQQRQGKANGTIRKRLSRLSKILSCAATRWVNPETRRPYLDYVPAFPDSVGTPNVRKVNLAEADERRVYEYCDQQAQSSVRGHQWWLFKQFIMWQIDTGMRKNESLLVGHDRIADNTVMLYDGETKNGDGRPIPLTTRLQKMVGVFKSMELGAAPFFASLTASKIFEMWDDARTALDLGHVTIHDLRRTRGQRLYDSGVPLEVISELLGHRDIRVTARVYTQRTVQHLRQWTDHAEEQGGLRAVK